MANLIGGIPPYPGKNNHIFGTDEDDFIFGDPFTTGNFFGVPEVGGILSSGKGGNDHIDGLGGNDCIYGDAFEMDGNARAGNDRLIGGDGDGDGDDYMWGGRGWRFGKCPLWRRHADWWRRLGLALRRCRSQ